MMEGLWHDIGDDSHHSEAWDATGPTSMPIDYGTLHTANVDGLTLKPQDHPRVYAKGSFF